MRLKQGEHNESLSNYLLALNNGQYNDWVVTTAFYACIHFVEHKIFPCKLAGHSYETFEDYCDYEYNAQSNNLSRHRLKQELVDKMLPGAKSQYRFLKDACMNSRYNDYQVTANKAKSCNDTMNVIKRACIKNTVLS